MKKFFFILGMLMSFLTPCISAETIIYTSETGSIYENFSSNQTLFVNYQINVDGAEKLKLTIDLTWIDFDLYGNLNCLLQDVSNNWYFEGSVDSSSTTQTATVVVPNGIFIDGYYSSPDAAFASLEIVYEVYEESTISPVPEDHLVTTPTAPIGLEHNVLFGAKDKYVVSQTGPVSFTLDQLFDSNLATQVKSCSSYQLSVEPYTLTLTNQSTNITEVKNNGQSYFGFSSGCEYPPKKVLIEYMNSGNEWNTLYSSQNNTSKDIIIPLSPGVYKGFKITVQEGTSSQFGFSEVFLINPKGTTAYDGLFVKKSDQIKVETDAPDDRNEVMLGNFADLDPLSRGGDFPAIFGEHVIRIPQRVEFWGGGAGKQYIDIRNQNGDPKIKLDAEGNTYFNNSGNVGIGTDSPTEGLLHIYKDATMGDWANITTANAGLKITEYNSNIGGLASLYFDGNSLFTNNSLYLGTLSNNYISIGTNHSEKIRITAEGNVGIGTIDPSSSLHIYDSSQYLLKVQNNLDYDAGIEFETNLANYKLGAGIGTASNSFVIYDLTSHQQRLMIDSQGNLGIGVLDPSTKLEVNGNISVGANTADESTRNTEYGSKLLFLGAHNNGTDFWIARYNVTASPAVSELRLNLGKDISDGDDKDKFVIGCTDQNGIWTPQFTFFSNGGLGINTPDMPSEAKLAVNGAVLATEFKIKLDVTDWADFVFEEDYNLRSLDEVKNYIEENNHLPEIPSATEIVDGVNLGELNVKLLQKVEELTLYIIEQNKRLEEQNLRILELENTSKK